MNDNHLISQSLNDLIRYIQSHDYSGYDPYDALNGVKLGKLQNKFIKLAVTQFCVYSPINLRFFFKIEPEKNPKTIGLFLQAYCKLVKHGFIEKKDFDLVSRQLEEFLIHHRSEGYSEYCWGFNFDWQDQSRYAKKGLPTIVITSVIANAFLELYELTNDSQFLNIAQSSCQFLLKNLHITKTERGICFSYTPIDQYIVHNANALGAALLARMYSITNEENFFVHSKQAFDFLLSFQRDDGSWAYSVNLQTEKERNQIDFHQGFIIDSIYDFVINMKPEEEKYKNALMKGAEFYCQRQFDDKGRSKWRLPWRLPVDIHNQAQGIITCCKLYNILHDKKYIMTAEKIALWTIENMWDKNGFFYYQKLPFFTNKISYMRWGQAWMMLALATLLDSKDI
jgi:hypothetical protein